MGESGSSYSASLREEELKNKVAKDWFSAFDTTRIIGNIDFCVDIPATELALGFEAEPMLWAEAKAGNRKDIVASFVQLILTIGGQHTADKILPPHFLGAFDAEKIAFLPYNAVLDVLGKNDFDWTVAPSDHESKEFKELYALAKGAIEKNKLLFRFSEDAAALRRFIKSNFKSGRRDITKILINKNNFTHIYRQWREAVLPFINAPWDLLKKKYGIYDSCFYLAEMNIDDNGTAELSDDFIAVEGFTVTFDARSSTPYAVKRKNEDGLFSPLMFGFKPGGIDAYAAFWRRYKRPPKKEYWNFIVNRLDLLVPQDVRERKGSFFTPPIWVEKSQKYLADVLGENWQDDHFVWDCCAGTGNLLVGLTNKYNIWASTLDAQDVDVMRERIKNGANLLDSHVFRFDFLNDSFDKLPQGLRDIIADPEKRKMLVVYINPPYAEATTASTVTGTGANKAGVAVSHLANTKYRPLIGAAANEVFSLFLMRISDEISGCVVGHFSKLKHLQGSNFKMFRNVFHGMLEKSFLVPADTFDNVTGKFPIGFFVWRLDKENVFASTIADVYDREGEFACTKKIFASDGESINRWAKKLDVADSHIVGYMENPTPDFQNNNFLCVINTKGTRHNNYFKINSETILASCVYFAVRFSVEATWLNDRDQFLFPNDGWKNDEEFQVDCLIYTLFHGQNRISSRDGVNHWIPFTEAEVDAKECFASHFMSDFLNLVNPVNPVKNLSPAAKSVLDAGRELWRYYHAQPGANPNASYYDIRLHFQGATVDAKGKSKMNSTSSDETYTSLLANLRAAMKNLARQIEPKVYEYGFLRR